MRFTKIPIETFESIQLNAGIIVDSFNTTTGEIGRIIGATTGGISFQATPSFTDFAEDIDNAAKNMMEFKRLDQWEAKMSGTFATISADLAKALTAAADKTGSEYIKTQDTAPKPGRVYYTRSGEDPNYVYTPVTNPTAESMSDYYVRTKTPVKITPRADLALADFSDKWWIGDYSSYNGDTKGGFCAIRLINSLSTGGFQIQSGDKAKGQFGFEFTGHYSNANPSIVPFEIYIKIGDVESTDSSN